MSKGFKMMKFVSIAICMLLLSCAAHQKRSQFDSADYAITYPHVPLSEEVIKQDIELLTHALEHIYIGRFYSPLAPSIENIIDDLKKLSIQKAMLRQEFCQKMATYLKKAKDQHLNISLENQSCFQSERPVFLGQNFAGKDFWKVDRKKNTLFVAIKTMSPDASIGWDKLFGEVKRKGKGAHQVVFDLRQNQGGGTGPSFHLLDLITQNQIPSPFATKVTNQGYLAMQVFLNFWNQNPMILKSKNEYYLGLKDAFEKQKMNKRAVEIFESEDKAINKNNSIETKLKFIALVDGTCVSACEMFLMKLRQLKNVTLVGSKTAGGLHTGETGFFMLPYSKLIVTMPISAFNYHSGEFFEGIGITPDKVLRNEREMDSYVKGLY